MQPDVKYQESKSKQSFYEINQDMYMIFQEKTSVNFNSCNTYLIRAGNKVNIIDPGCSRLNLVKVLRKLNIDIGDIENILLTHAHSDHYALVKYLKKKGHPEVFIHPADRKFLESKKEYIDFLFEKEFFKHRQSFRISIRC